MRTAEGDAVAIANGCEPIRRANGLTMGLVDSVGEHADCHLLRSWWKV
jgi:hypothetical protein